MARPKTKTELTTAAQEQYEKLMELIDSLPEAAQNGLFHFDESAMGKEAHWQRDKNIRDVLIHLYEWHQLFIKWVGSNQKGETISFLPPPYNWKTYGDMNVGFWKKHQDTTYEAARKMLAESHNEVTRLIDTFSDTQLFTKGVFGWTGGSTLGSYGVSVTSSHYDWAVKKIKKYKKSL